MSLMTTIHTLGEVIILFVKPKNLEIALETSIGWGSHLSAKETKALKIDKTVLIICKKLIKKTEY